MAEIPNSPAASKSHGWQSREIMAMCVVCLAIGLLVGYLLKGSAPNAAVPVATPAEAAMNSPNPAMHPSATMPQQPKQMPSLDDMKRMADKKAEPLLAKLKTDDKNPQLLNQIALVYKSAHQFKDAAEYFGKSLEYDPKNIGVRADYASCLYFTGDVDGALAQLNKSLTYDPKHAGTLLNIGIIKWQGKHDLDGAVASWQKLLQYHPDFPQKEMVQQMITKAQADAKAGAAGQKS